jgi:membrane-bound ClpP family serine protease
MDPIILIFLLLAAGIVLLFGELLLPTGGILGLIGLLCFGGVMVVAFTIDKWLGLAVFLGSVAASPFLVTLGMKLWTRSFVGRRIILQPVEATRPVVPVKIGDVGEAVTDLRPMGECDFAGQRIESISEHGIIRRGEKVRVVGMINGRATVRLATERESASSG